MLGKLDVYFFESFLYEWPKLDPLVQCPPGSWWIRDRGRKEGNVLFNDALNTFYFTVIWRRTYGKGPLR